ncbi:GvpL/GvpF family gas vesicle protein [bacterium]|nr:GvpL/GvpF family gas vesicle protein [bacterium]
MSELATYLYGVVRSKRKPSLARTPRGLPGAGKTRLVDAGRSLWLVAASVPLARYGEKPIEESLRDLDWVSRCAVAHEKTVERFLGAEALLPMKIFTIFTSDERALSYVEKDRERIEELLGRVAGCSEWGVRVVLDSARAKEAAESEARAAVGAASAGTGFLLRKKKARDAVRELASHARERIDAAFEKLERVAREARKRPPLAEAGAGSRLLLDASYLVPAKSGARFRVAASAVAKELSERGYALTLTGPWPPYSFAAGAP